MVTGMVAATVSGFTADVERKWMAQIAPETEGARDRSAERKFAVKIAEVAGMYGLSQKAEQEWLSAIGAHV